MIIELTFRFKDKDKVYYTKFWSLDKSTIYDKNGYFWDENGLSAILDHDIGENLCNDNFPKYIDKDLLYKISKRFAPRVKRMLEID